MVQLNQTYNTEEVKTTPNNNVCVPDGDYKAVIINSEFAQSPYDSSDPQGLKLKVVITDGKYANTEFEQFLGINDIRPVNPEKNPNFTRQQAALGTLGQIASALGIDSFNDTSLFHNQPLLINTGTRLGKDKETGAHKPEWDSSFIKQYKALPKTGVEGQQQAFTPPASNPEPAQDQPSPAPAQSAPWAI